MPRKIATESAEDRALRELDESSENTITRIANESGPPPDADKLSERDEDDIWELADPNVDRDALAQRLAVEGLPPEEIKGLLIVKARPDWAQLFAAPTQSMELADQYARMAQYPWRWSLLEDIDDPDEMVRKAETLNRRFQRRVTAAQDQQAMMPEPTLRGYGEMASEMEGV